MATFDTLQNRWLDYHPTKTQVLWFAAACVAATLVVGFGLLGWVSAGSAEKQVTKAADDARHELAAAICVDGFMKAGAAGERLAKLQEMSWFVRSDEIAKAGWATMPDREEPNTTVAIMCATRLGELKPGTL